MKIRRLRTELAYITGDRAHGGPPREKEMEELRLKLRKLAEES